MITKEDILNKIGEEALIKNLVPSFDPLRKKNYKSIFSEKDNNPSLSFYKDGGKWKFKSFNIPGCQGDVFQMYGFHWKIDTQTNFPELLNRLAQEFNLTSQNQQKAKRYEIEHFLSYTKLFLKYWEDLGVSEDILKKYNVLQTKSFKIEKNGNVFHFDYEKMGALNVCYSMNGRIKLYSPSLTKGFGGLKNFKSQKKKFGFKDQTSKDIFGISQLAKEQQEYIILTAGEKDCLVANAHGFNAISLQSENQYPTKELMIQLRQKAKYILTCYDNDEAGRKATKHLRDNFGMSSIKLPEEFNDLTDFFKMNKPSDLHLYLRESLMDQRRIESQPKEYPELQSEPQAPSKPASTPTGKVSVFHLAEEYILGKYDLRFNLLKQSYELSLKGLNRYINIDDDEFHNIYSGLRKQCINITQADLRAILNKHFCPEFNPVETYFKGLKKWNPKEEDHISKLASYIETDRSKEWSIALKKWLVRAIKCVFEENSFNKYALILVQTKQNTGKSFFCRFLCPKELKGYFTETLEIHDKDSKIALADNFMINLDELQQFKKQSNMETLKSMLSSSKVKVRPPYGKRPVVRNRISSFIGSTNNSQFLTDETGNVRWQCFSLKKINFDYNNIRTGKKEVDINDVWSQAYSLYLEGFDGELTEEELESSETTNRNFKELSIEEEKLLEYFQPSDKEGGMFMSATKIAEFLQERTNLKLNPTIMGKILISSGFTKVVHKRIYGYWVASI